MAGRVTPIVETSIPSMKLAAHSNRSGIPTIGFPGTAFTRVSVITRFHWIFWTWNRVDIGAVPSLWHRLRQTELLQGQGAWSSAILCCNFVACTHDKFSQCCNNLYENDGITDLPV